MFVHKERKGKQIHMGISDRDYMRKPVPQQEPPKPRAHLKKADNKPSLLKRLRFWFWNLTHKG